MRANQKFNFHFAQACHIFPRLHEDNSEARRFSNRCLQTYVERVGQIVNLALLGIHTSEQVSRDPLRGNLYENFIIADIVKSALNRGIRPEIYFFRDSHGNEIDLLVREKGVLTPVEIKSAATFTTDFIRQIELFQTLGIRRVVPGAILYNGEQTFNVRGVRVINPLQVEDIWQTLIEFSEQETT